jgi:hypothetical protein
MARHRPTGLCDQPDDRSRNNRKRHTASSGKSDPRRVMVPTKIRRVHGMLLAFPRTKAAFALVENVPNVDRYPRS